jgi:hypothetical protein
MGYRAPVTSQPYSVSAVIATLSYMAKFSCRTREPFHNRPRLGCQTYTGDSRRIIRARLLT